MEKLVADGRLLCLDRDPVAVAEARARFAADPRVSIFSRPLLAACGVRRSSRARAEFDGILFDLGVSSPQLDDASRGFSFMQDGPLDMRMSKGEGMSAADVVNGASEGELIRIFREYGEERFAPRIARAIVTDRQLKPFERTLELAEMISRVARSRDSRTAAPHRGWPPRQASGDAGFSGAAHPREPRTRRTRNSRCRPRSSAWRRTGGSP